MLPKEFDESLIAEYPKLHQTAGIELRTLAIVLSYFTNFSRIQALVFNKIGRDGDKQVERSYLTSTYRRCGNAWSNVEITKKDCRKYLFKF